MKKYVLIFLIVICLSLTVGVAFSNTALDKEREDYYENLAEKPMYTSIKAKIIDVPLDETEEDREDVPLQSDMRLQHLKIEIITGSHKGEIYTVRNLIYMINPYKLIFKNGDEMVLRMTEDENGKIVNLKVYEKVRDKYVYGSILLLIIILIILGGKNGIKTILSLLFTGFVIAKVLIPNILNGMDPIFISIIVAVMVSMVTIFLIMGKNKKAVSALLGTVAGLIVSGTLAIIVGNLSSLTGLGSEEAQMIAYIPRLADLNYKGILYAGILIGALGAIMDVTISIASSMWEMYQIHPEIKRKELMKSGFNVGRDIMGSMSNTLILAYTGSSIFLMLLFSGYNLTLMEVINMDVISSEIIRAIVGSIGLILAIPFTVIITGIMITEID